MTVRRLLVATALLAAPAYAQDSKPPAELQAYQMMIGTWKCAGKVSMGGKEFKTTGTYKVAWELDKRWVVAHAEGKSPDMPGTHSGLDLYGYDATTKVYTHIGVDNFGNLTNLMSKGWEGDKQEWVGTNSGTGPSAETKVTIVKKGDKEFDLTGSMGAAAWESVCKK
jgi:hypothetical protein